MKVPRYERKVSYVEALRYDGTNFNEIEAWLGHGKVQTEQSDTLIVWNDFEGKWLLVHVGEWIARSSEQSADVYPIADERFVATWIPAR